MYTENLTPNTLLAILKANGYDTTKASISRYMQDGLVMRPLQKPTRQKKEERAYYHPLAIIEVMAAILLFRGDYLEYKSQQRIARLTDRDLFYGRICHYANLFPTRLIGLEKYYTSIDNYPFEEFEYKNKLIMNYKSVKSYQTFISKKLDEELGLREEQHLSKAYKNFSYFVYADTFNHLCKIHEEMLSNIDDYIKRLK